MRNKPLPLVFAWIWLFHGVSSKGGSSLEGNRWFWVVTNSDNPCTQDYAGIWFESQFTDSTEWHKMITMENPWLIGLQVCFDVHERFKHLVAETVQSRLLLASLYAGTDCGLPDPRLGATELNERLHVMCMFPNCLEPNSSKIGSICSISKPRSMSYMNFSWFHVDSCYINLLLH